MSRFVSGGTNDDEPFPSTDADPDDAAWQQAQHTIDAKRAPPSTSSIQDGSGGGGKSLYETLQANKAAKQEAFEESMRLKNQFRSLDEDEVEFLDSVLESTRQREEEVKRETEKGLDAFRRRQMEEEGRSKVDEGEAGGEGKEAEGEAEVWTTARKRKRGAKEREVVVGGVKVRRTSSSSRATQQTGAASMGVEAGKSVESEASNKHRLNASSAAAAVSPRPSPSQEPTGQTSKTSSPSPPPAAAGLGLAAYSSDEDD